ncbi:MAG TPA: hypothetical protein VME45_19160 [Stellaceae bacterium]|nr:hypothetical protein [Stellaceae bacterium]
MKRHLPTGLALVLGFAALLGTAVPPALADGPTVGCPPPVKHHVVLHVRHHWVHRYVTRTVYREVWLAGCGSTVHPCNVDHIVVPLD